MEEPSLIQAAYQGDKAAVDSILAAHQQDRSIDLEERDEWLERTPLQHATEAGHLRIVETPHDAGASINIQDKFGRTPLHIAVNRARYAIARYLLRNDVDITLKDQWAVEVMEHAGLYMQIILLEHGVAITKEQDLEELLFLAAEQGNLSVVQRLVETGAQVQVKDSYGYSPYETARQAGNTEVAKYLDRIGKDLRKRRQSSFLPVQAAPSAPVNAPNIAMTTEPEAIAEEDEAEHAQSITIDEQSTRDPNEPESEGIHSFI